MPREQLFKRLDNLVWVLIFGGLFTLVLGIASHGDAEIAGWSLSVVGAVAVIAGVVLIFVRARMSGPAAGAQSSTANNKTRDQA